MVESTVSSGQSIILRLRLANQLALNDAFKY